MRNSPLWLLPWLLLALLTTKSMAATSKIPRLSVLLGSKFRNTSTKYASQTDESETFFYEQTLDHFNYQLESYTTFPQRYVVNSKYWGGARVAAPIFAYLGAESSIDDDFNGGVGFLNENAARFSALQVYIEHRYYGKSMPFGSKDEAFKNASTRGYFNSAQALADYAEILTYLRKNLSAESSPIIVVGGSYGGMLAAWFRLKYPHLTLGALASSAPVLYLDDITPQDGYSSVVTKDFREVSESCYQTIKESWSLIAKIAAQDDGLDFLSKTFRTCKPLENATDIKDYLNSLYSEAAQYDSPPKYPVTMFCGGVDGAHEGTDILGRIFLGIVAFKGNKTCYEFDSNASSESGLGWDWQTCSEMVMPMGINDNSSIFPEEPFDIKEFTDKCIEKYGVPPRPHWITTYYGGHDMKLILKRFGSNIIFSNGLRDPYSSAGVLEDISDSILALHTLNGSHCLDIVPSREDDPKWLIMLRNVEVEIINGWILKYYQDLLQNFA